VRTPVIVVADGVILIGLGRAGFSTERRVLANRGVAARCVGSRVEGPFYVMLSSRHRITLSPYLSARPTALAAFAGMKKDPCSFWFEERSVLRHHQCQMLRMRTVTGIVMAQ